MSGRGEIRLALPCGKDAPAQARSALRDFVQEWNGGQELSYMAQLAITEALSEFLERHGESPQETMGIRAVFADGRLHIVIEGIALTNFVDSLRLRIVEAVTDELSFEIDPAGETLAVSFTFPRE